MTGFDHRDSALGSEPEAVVIRFSGNENVAPLGNETLLIADVDEETQAAPWKSNSTYSPVDISSSGDSELRHAHSFFHPFNQHMQGACRYLVNLYESVSKDGLSEFQYFGKRIEDADLVQRAVQTQKGKVMLFEERTALAVDLPLFPICRRTGKLGTIYKFN